MLIQLPLRGIHMFSAHVFDTTFHSKHQLARKSVILLGKKLDHTMDVSTANYDTARRYLNRHSIRQVFEQCEHDLLSFQPKTDDEVTECIVNTLRTLERQKVSPPTKTLLILCEPGAFDVSKGMLAEAAKTVPNTASIDVRSVSEAAGAILAQESGVVLLNTTKFPTIADTMDFENAHFKFHAALLLKVKSFETAPDAVRRRYAHDSNPLVAYFRAQNRLLECTVDSSPAQLFEVVRQCAEEKKQ